MTKTTDRVALVAGASGIVGFAVAQEFKRQTGASLPSDRCVLMSLYSEHRLAGSGAELPSDPAAPALLPLGSDYPFCASIKLLRVSTV